MSVTTAIRSAAVAVCGLILCAGPAAAASNPASVVTSPALKPAFAARASDYTVRCKPGESVRVTVKAPRGTRISVDGAPARSGRFRRSVGLAEGQAFRLKVTRKGHTRTHFVRCVPQDFPTWRVSRHGKPAVGLFAFAPAVRITPPEGAPYSVIADNRGVPIWWKRAPVSVPADTKVLPDGSVIWARLGGAFSQNGFDRVSLDGQALPVPSTVGVGADQHDVQLLPSGNFLMITYVPREHVDLTSLGGPSDATVLDGELQEVTPAGALVWSWTTKDHIELAESKAFGVNNTKVMYAGQPAYDIVHLNSVEERGDSLLVSTRHTDALYSVRRSDGVIRWKLGGTHRPESLKFKKDPLGAKSFGGQHDARLLPDGTVSVHDNGSLRGRPPRVARYRIDAKARTATLVEQVTDKRVKASFCCGSARRLPGGHWLVSWGAAPIVTELTAKGRPVLTLTFPDKLFSYRAQPVDPTLASRARLRAGMDAQYPR